MQATETSLDQAVVALYRAARLAQRLTRNDPVDVAQSRILVAIKRLGPSRPSVIAADVHVDLSTASRHIDALVRKDLVAKHSDPHDARAALVALTPQGKRTLTTLVKNRTQAIEPALAAWSANDRDALVGLLTRLADDLDSHLAQEDS